MSADPRVAAAGALLADHGIHGASIAVEGHDDEIAALRVPEDAWDALVADGSGELSRAVKALGFRYVAVDLLAAEE